MRDSTETVEVWALTPSIPERGDLLRDAVASVASQTFPVRRHLVGVDVRREGPAAVRNSLLDCVPSGEWVSFIDDDDVWHPDHVEVLTTVQARTGVDVVYSLASVVGRPGWDPQRRKFDAAALRRGNYIPLNGIVRAGMLREAGGFPDAQYEDWGMWLNLLDAGATFACTGVVTWDYRFGDWDSRSKEVWDGRR